MTDAGDEDNPKAVPPPTAPARVVPPPRPPAPVLSSPINKGLHALLLLCSFAVVVTACLLEVRADGRVFFRFAPEKVLPETCTSKVLFNFECAGCGLTRSFVHLAAFRPMQSLRVHRAGWMLALIVAFQVPYRILRLVRPEKKVPDWFIWALPIALVSVFLHWILKLNGV